MLNQYLSLQTFNTPASLCIQGIIPLPLHHKVVHPLCIILRAKTSVNAKVQQTQCCVCLFSETSILYNIYYIINPHL